MQDIGESLRGQFAAGLHERESSYCFEATSSGVLHRPQCKTGAEGRCPSSPEPRSRCPLQTSKQKRPIGPKSSHGQQTGPAPSGPRRHCGDWCLPLASVGPSPGSVLLLPSSLLMPCDNPCKAALLTQSSTEVVRMRVMQHDRPEISREVAGGGATGFEPLQTVHKNDNACMTQT